MLFLSACILPEVSHDLRWLDYFEFIWQLLLWGWTLDFQRAEFSTGFYFYAFLQWGAAFINRVLHIQSILIAEFLQHIFTRFVFWCERLKVLRLLLFIVTILRDCVIIEDVLFFEGNYLIYSQPQWAVVVSWLRWFCKRRGYLVPFSFLVWWLNLIQILIIGILFEAHSSIIGKRVSYSFNLIQVFVL